MVKKIKKLNKFEESRLFSARAEELAAGDKPNVESAEGKVNLTKDYINLAKEEYDSDKFDLEIYED